MMGKFVSTFAGSSKFSNRHFQIWVDLTKGAKIVSTFDG